MKITELCELTDLEAWALAQFLKRITFESIAAHAKDETETYRMRDALYQVQKVLNEEGYNPR